MRPNERLSAAAAALVLVVGMGFSRFAFTGLYPLMVKNQQISVTGGSYAASANYAGYLIGALLAALLSGISSRRLCTYSIFSSVALLGLLALSLPEWSIVTIRGFAGIFSAMAMVAASHWLIHDRRHHDGAPTLFAGVGIGILLSAELIAAGSLAGMSSYLVWLTLALAAVVMDALAMALQRRVEQARPITMPATKDQEGRSHLARAVLFLSMALLVSATSLRRRISRCSSKLRSDHSIPYTFGQCSVLARFRHVSYGTDCMCVRVRATAL
ncbi:YbfB/YjiJ family MFS transporter [Rhizobium tropici]|uniref:YbfB/YjiJ family MFS transporter n=1 Tax=Rhizobium tropici TaxID=398 RepID=UPI001AED95B5|nr:YbfB/YjiJ family MFS transporter [Rhizobium tropici]